MVFDALLLLATAALLVTFMEHPAGLAGAAVCCAGAGACLGRRPLDRSVVRPYELTAPGRDDRETVPGVGR